ncbi:head-tail adaptor protein [Paralcaligenes ginsengisoli]
MLAHRLRHRVIIQEQVNAQDPTTGAIALTWQNVWLDSNTELVDVPAEVLTGPGKELNQSGTVQAEVAARITLRWFPGLMQSMRILWDGQIFNIGSIETDITARREYRLRCISGVSDGQ